MITRILWCALLLGLTAQSQQAAGKSKDNSKQSDFYLRDIARQAGNIGGWWGLLNENEKGAFLSGYQAAMKMSYAQSMGLCKGVKDRLKPSNDKQAFDDQVGTAIGICTTANEFDGFDKITIKDLDSFYTDRLNQAMAIEWSMAYLRDKVTGRKTKGQLLDALDTEQKDVHDCSKYPHLCKLGAEEPQPPR